jgi:hypothetical protein
MQLPDFLKPDPLADDLYDNEFVLRFSPTYWGLTCVFLVVGLIADWNWLIPIYQGQPDSLAEWQMFFCIFPFFAIVGIFLGLHSIRVTRESIESWHFFVFKATPRSSGYILKYTSTGYILSDQYGQRIRVNKLMIGAGRLHALFSKSLAPDTSLEEGIQRSSGMRAVNIFKFIKAAFMSLCMMAGGSLLVFRGIQDWTQATKDAPPSVGGDLFLICFGLAMVAICLGVWIYVIVKLLKRRAKT